jgi:hypothetical protein
MMELLLILGIEKPFDPPGDDDDQGVCPQADIADPPSAPRNSVNEKGCLKDLNQIRSG